MCLPTDQDNQELHEIIMEFSHINSHFTFSLSKVVKNGLITNKMPSSAASKSKNNAPEQETAKEEVNTFDDLKTVVEKQADTIKTQKTEIELLRKQMEKNVHLTQDFQSELRWSSF